MVGSQVQVAQGCLILAGPVTPQVRWRGGAEGACMTGGALRPDAIPSQFLHHTHPYSETKEKEEELPKPTNRGIHSK